MYCIKVSHFRGFKLFKIRQKSLSKTKKVILVKWEFWPAETLKVLILSKGWTTLSYRFIHFFCLLPFWANLQKRKNRDFVEVLFSEQLVLSGVLSLRFHTLTQPLQESNDVFGPSWAGKQKAAECIICRYRQSHIPYITYCYNVLYINYKWPYMSY